MGRIMARCNGILWNVRPMETISKILNGFYSGFLLVSPNNSLRLTLDQNPNVRKDSG